MCHRERDDRVLSHCRRKWVERDDNRDQKQEKMDVEVESLALGVG